MVSTPANGTAGELRAPVRNRYFYGKMLDVFHFELEQDYFNQKRWLINQRVIGYGVVCGLDVHARARRPSIVVHPGLAIDRCGRGDRRSATLPSAPDLAATRGWRSDDGGERIATRRHRPTRAAPVDVHLSPVLPRVSRRSRSRVRR